VPDWIHNYPSWTQDLNPRKIIRTIHGFDIVCDTFDYVGRHVIADKDWESLIGRTISVCARKDGLCLDIGANMGFHTLVMSKSVGPGGRVISFEPDLRNLSALINNIRLNKISHILPVSLALSDHVQIVNMAAPSGINYGLSNLRESAEGNKGHLAMVVRGDMLPLLKHGETVSLVKIDVEGLEVQVLSGLSGILDRIQHLICEVSPEWADVTSIFTIMKNAGFNYVATPPIHGGKWFKPETKKIDGQHDALFYRTMSPELAALVE